MMYHFGRTASQRAALVTCHLIGLFFAILPHADTAAAEPTTRSVLIVTQSQPDGRWHTAATSTFESILSLNSATPISVYKEDLDLDRFSGPGYEEILRNFLREKYRAKPMNIVFAFGTAALQFVLRVRADLWSGVPVVFAVGDPSIVARLELPSNVTGRIIRLTLHNAVVAARVVVPNLKNIALVGDPLEQQVARRHFVREIPEIAAEVGVFNLTGLAMTDVRNRLAALPDDSAIIYTPIRTDGAGVNYRPHNALAELAEVANRPIVIDVESDLGYGGVGGFIAVPEAIGEESARLVLRILSGEDASAIPIVVGDFVKPIFVERELKRWNVSEDRLPAGSEVRLRQAGLWEQYQWHAFVVGGIVLGQAILIVVLIVEHRARFAAEAESRRHLVEVAYLNRRSELAASSASIAHELNQPLGAILSNAEAAELYLKADPPKLEEVEKILADIRRDDQRAADVIKHLRTFFKKKPVEVKKVDVNEVLREAGEILALEAREKGINLATAPDKNPLTVLADPVHLQQVVLNLGLNGMEAMRTSVLWRPSTLRRSKLLIKASEVGSTARVEIIDAGPGIPPDKLRKIFEPYYTTKRQGTGLGLSIAREIVQAYGGSIWAENRPEGGAVFSFSLPLSREHVA